MNGGPASPGFGTQGSAVPPSTLPQQSALDVQAWPAPTHEGPSVHRGTPTVSNRHVSYLLQLPEQQSHDALHEITDPRVHTSPLGMQACPASFWKPGFWQIPSLAPGAIVHWPVWSPQQSLSFEQMSPTTWQPLAGWQTSTPVGPNGAQRRLQQLPPHTEAPLSGVTTPPQTVPSTIVQFALPVGGGAHVPKSPAPASGTLHMPLQQSLPDPHVSLVCWQKDEGWQVPFALHSIEQQSEFCAQELPSLWHPPVGRAAHVPAPPASEAHRPPQHCTLLVQLWPSLMQSGKVHDPPVHVPLQQSPGWAHPPPRLMQLPPESGWNGLASGSMPPLDAPLEDAPLEDPPSIGPPLELEPEELPSSDKVPSPPAPSPDKVPSTAPSSPPDEAPEEAPDEFPSVVPSAAPPSLRPDPFVVLLPQPTAASTTASAAIFVNPESRTVILIAAPSARRRQTHSSNAAIFTAKGILCNWSQV